MKNNPAPSTQSTAPHTTTATIFKPRVRRLGPGRYLVESASRPGRGHTTTPTSCSCVGFSYRKDCKHVALVQALEPAMQHWYGQVVPPACPAVEEEHASGVFMVTNTTLDAQAAAAAARRGHARRARADTDSRDDSYAVLWRQVDGLEREVAALHYASMRAA